MMLRRSEQQAAADPVTQTYERMEQMLMQNIIRHVKNYDQLIDSDEWLMQKLAEIGKLNKENISIISKVAKGNRKAIENMCYEVADLVLSRIEPGFKDYERILAVEEDEYVPPVSKSKNVKKAVETVYNQAWDTLNKTNTNMLYMAQDAFRNFVKRIVDKADEIKNKQSFIDILDKHATAEAIGAESRGQAIRSVIREFNDKGIPAFVDKRGRQWTPEAYVGMTLRTTANNVSTEAMFARMEDRGFNLIQVSSHSGARPKCAKDQGKIFDKNNSSGEVEDGRGRKIKYYPWRTSSYGEPDGLFGINCGHHGTPFIPGVSSQRYFPTDDLEENTREYKKMQTQRALERDVRKQKRLCSLYDEVGDKDSFKEASVVLKRKEAHLADYTKKNGLIRRKDREQVVGFDKRISAEAVGANKRVQKALAQKAKDDKIKTEIKKTGMRGEISLRPEKLDVSGFTFDDAHINKEKEHQVTRSEAEQYVREADVAFKKWNGRFVNYYGPNGAVFVDTENQNIRTAFRREQYDERTRKMREVLEREES